jgi:hypothetical protein
MVKLYITDAFTNGDYFEVYEVNGVSPTTAYLIGVTPIVPVATAGIVDPDAAFASPVFSHAVFSLNLGPGTHYFAFREVGHNFAGGAFYIKFCGSAVGGVVAAEPNIVPFAALGFALFGVVGVVLVHKRMGKGKNELD